VSLLHLKEGKTQMNPVTAAPLTKNPPHPHYTRVARWANIAAAKPNPVAPITNTHSPKERAGLFLLLLAKTVGCRPAPIEHCFYSVARQTSRNKHRICGPPQRQRTQHNISTCCSKAAFAN